MSRGSATNSGISSRSGVMNSGYPSGSAFSGTGRSSGHGSDDNPFASWPAKDRAARREIRRDLLIEMMTRLPFEAAANFWRCIELPEISSVLPHRGRGLEIGCGGPLSPACWLDTPRNVRRPLVGVAVDGRELDRARTSGKYNELHASPSTKIPELSASFDFAFAASQLERVADLGGTLREAARCLKPGAGFYATVSAPSFARLLRGPGGLRRRSRTDYLAAIDERLGIVRRLTLDEWTTHLAAVGIELVEVRGFLAPRQVRRWEKWFSRDRGMMRRLFGTDRAGRPRFLPRILGFVGVLLAWNVAYGVIDDDAANPYETGRLLLVGRRRD
jgi:SAM-dependent methyltransferase